MPCGLACNSGDCKSGKRINGKTAQAVIFRHSKWNAMTQPQTPPPPPPWPFFLLTVALRLTNLKQRKKEGPLAVLSSLVHAKTPVRVSLKSKYYKDYHAR